MLEYSRVIMGISGNNGNSHHIPDSAVSLATAAKVHGLTVCYTIKLDDEGRVFIDELKLKTLIINVIDGLLNKGKETNDSKSKLFRPLGTKTKKILTTDEF